MAFIAAMNAPVQRTTGVNGALVYTADGIGDLRVALYTSLVRGLGREEIKQFVDKAVAEGAARSQESAYERDLWVLAFQCRDVRGGKGERTAALNLFAELCSRWGYRIEPMLRLWAEYGCWRDLFVLASEEVALHDWILKIVSEQFWADWTAHKAGKPFSLLAKWLPREGSALDQGFVADLTRVLYPGRHNIKSRFPIYRRQVARLSAALKVVENNMCNGTWAEVKPGAVPGRCLNLNRKAFLNQKLKGSGERRTDEDRRTCAANFKEHLAAVLSGKATVKGGSTVYPHSICRQVRGVSVDSEEMQLLEAQWSAIRDKVKEAGKMGRVLPMCDFSGSMSGIPMDVSMGLGILLSELNHEAFKNCVLSFDAKPHWITFRENMRLVEKCREAERHGQGLNTNFEAALSLVLDRLVEHNVPACEAPEDIVVFTDMGFDQASGQTGAWATLVTNMKARFRAANYVMPRLVIWNLRAAFKEYHAKADEEGVLMLSGWSPSSMKVIMEGIKVQTPYEGMRAILDDARYDPVRQILSV
jgi:hypothetical protein